jgi:hypothetical protein
MHFASIVGLSPTSPRTLLVAMFLLETKSSFILRFLPSISCKWEELIAGSVLPTVSQHASSVQH